MKYEAQSVDGYIAALPPERREMVNRLREVIRDNLPPGFEETLSYGMPSFVVPFSAYPSGYHCNPKEPLPFIGIGSQKNHIGFYHMGLYARPDIIVRFATEYQKLGIGKLDMGKGCIRLKCGKPIPYGLLGALCREITVQEWIMTYEKNSQK